MQIVRIFVSSPGDAQFERMRVDRIVERLNGEFSGVARLETIRWEREFYKAHATFQDQIPQAADCDIVVTILRHRLGTELPDDFQHLPNGDPYPSGTAYEVLTAIEARKKRDLPDVYVFRNPEPPMVSLDDDEASALVKVQWEKLKTFFENWFVTPEGHFKAAFHEFRSTDEFELQFEQLLRKWLEDRVLKGHAVVWPIETKGSPFRGLAAFGTKHASVFFGRSKDISKATDALKDAAERGAPFLLIIGASGVGKSSMANAGLVPRLTTPGVVPAVDVWRVTVMRPSEHVDGPLAALATRLFDNESDIGENEKGRPVALPEIAESDHGTPKELADLLGHADDTTEKPILRALKKVEETEQKKSGYDRPVRTDLLLVVDQLDELFANDIDDKKREQFTRILSILADTGRVWIVATLRADLYERFLRQPKLLDLKTRGAAYDLAPPGAAEMAEIVRGPATAANLIYTADIQTGETLDDRLLRDVDQPDMLPLLQFTLNQLFDQRQTIDGEVRLTTAAYEALGGLSGAIEREAERAVASLGSAEIGAIPKLIRLLVTQRQDDTALSGGGKFTIRSASLAEIEADSPLRRLADALVSARILVMSDEGAGRTMRLVHQRIVEGWSRARDAIQENAEYFRILDDVKSQLRRWIGSGTHPSTLIPRGQSLMEARILEKRYSEELSDDIRSFILASINKYNFRKIIYISLISFVPYIIIAMFIMVNITIDPEFINMVIFYYFAFVYIFFPIAVLFNLWLYEINLKNAGIFYSSDHVLHYTIARKLFLKHMILLTAIRYLLIAIVAISIPMTIYGTFISPIYVSETEQYIRYFDERYNILLIAILIPFIQYIPLFMFRYAEKSKINQIKINNIRMKSNRYIDNPLAVLVIFVLISSVLSSLAFPRSSSSWETNIANPLFFVPAILFAIVLAFGEIQWGGGRVSAVILISAGVVFAWMLANLIAISIILGSNSVLSGRLTAGIIAGAIGAGLTALVIPTLRHSRRWEISTAIGAVAGVGIWLMSFFNDHTAVLFILWQTSFVAYYGYCLQGTSKN